MEALGEAKSKVKAGHRLEVARAGQAMAQRQTVFTAYRAW